MTYFRMAMCVDSTQKLERGEFDTVADGVAWIEENYPGWLKACRWESPDRGPEGPKQYGTDYHWAAFEPFAGPRPASDTLGSVRQGPNTEHLAQEAPVAAPLILARTFADAHRYAKDELGLSNGYYRVVTSAGTIKAVRNVDIHLVPGWDKRPDRFTMKSALKWCRLTVVDVEKLRESAAAFDAATAPASNTLEADEPDLPKIEITVVPDDTPVPQHHLDMVAKVLPVAESDEAIEVIAGPSAPTATGNIPTVVSDEAAALDKAAPKKRRTRCKDCGTLHFKGDPCPEAD